MPPTQKRAVYIGQPCYGSIVPASGRSIHVSATRKCVVYTAQLNSSLLAHGFNSMWCSALNRRQGDGKGGEPVTHFAMLHGDIVPEPWWVDELMTILDEKDADLVSVVSPIKDSRGVTSTAVDIPPELLPPEAHGWPMQRRLTLKEVHQLPETFSSADLGGAGLLVNTGCWLCRMDRPWCEQVYFDINSRIVKAADGKFLPQVESEDWQFSRMLNRLGARVFATRAVRLTHVGQHGYSNDCWGDCESDPEWPADAAE